MQSLLLPVATLAAGLIVVFLVLWAVLELESRHNRRRTMELELMSLRCRRLSPPQVWREG